MNSNTVQSVFHFDIPFILAIPFWDIFFNHKDTKLGKEEDEFGERDIRISVDEILFQPSSLIKFPLCKVYKLLECPQWGKMRESCVIQ